MTAREIQPLQGGRACSLHLEYGADAQDGAHDSVELSERGLQLRSRWRFEIGTELSVAFVTPAATGGARRRVSAVGIVVYCELLPGDPKMYESTMLFWDLPEELRQILRDFSLGG